MAKKKKKNKNNEKVKKQIKDTFILTVIICILMIGIYKTVSLISNPTDTFVLRKSTISLEESKVGYVIREEYIIGDEDTLRSIKTIKNEGEKVAANQPVLKYYNDNEEEYKDKIDINDENYFFPKKVFNLDGILPSMSIVIIIAIILISPTGFTPLPMHNKVQL